MCRINRDGTIFFSDKWQPCILTILQEFANNPQAVVANHGQTTGSCCFCNRPLTDERSLSVGYGSTCAKHYGLPWDEVGIEGQCNEVEVDEVTIVDRTTGSSEISTTAPDEVIDGSTEIPFESSQSLKSIFRIGISVEVKSGRYLEELGGKEGIVRTDDEEIGCVVDFDGQRKFIFYDDLAPALRMHSVLLIALLFRQWQDLIFQQSHHHRMVVNLGNPYILVKNI